MFNIYVKDKIDIRGCNSKFNNNNSRIYIIREFSHCN